ncbi:glycoside hydrolase [Sphingomonas sp. JC676]|uniref:glycosyl hydrolase n=1 Tax=Sphingomonas sp. JC676 TaxID=2768065 RepID=UPI001657ED71|nr:glycosyl hydrolase [Sphingomonas sp. JC676]MBC9032398.1 glycoside hydrolase [Sphingomonas sp. JC676]
MRRVVIFAALLLVAAPVTGTHAQDSRDTAASLWRAFQTPPDEARPMIRWWWFGPAVTDAEIDREIAAMKAGGFGGFEVQPTYALSLDDAPAGLRNLPYPSDGFLARLRHAGETARSEKMRIDVTIGSGWPFGGPHIPVTQAAAALRLARIPVPARAGNVPLPRLGPGERPVAVFIDGERIPLGDGEQIALPAAPGARTALLFVAGRTGQQVKRAAVGAEGFVLDHMSEAAVENHLHAIGDRLLSAFAGAPPPYAMFSDSLEAYGSSWTGDFAEQFRSRRGYDLVDRLPALFANGLEGDAIRYDWARTLTELVDARYLTPIDAWARKHGTRFRAQVYGVPPVTLSSNALVALPEGEGADWRNFTSTRWAASAAHLYGRPVVSSETWTWLHSPAWAATPLDMKVEADRHFLQGVTQIIGHGWPYSPPGVPEPGWAFYAAGAFNDHNPWYPAMPAVTGYLQRVSAALRMGSPDGSVAIYLPTEDAFAAMRPDDSSVNHQMTGLLGPELVKQALDAGADFDFIDAQAITARGLRQKVLILPRLTRIDPAAYRAIADWTARGGILIATGTPPSRGGGLLDGAAATREVAAISTRLFGKTGRARVVEPARLTAALRATAVPAMILDRPDPALGFVHRRLVDGDLYFLANTGAAPIETSARFTGGDRPGQWWDPVTGERSDAGAGAIAIRLAPYQSKLLVFTRSLPRPAPARTDQAERIADLTGWTVRLADGQPAPSLDAGRSWTDDPALVHYSGAATYARALTLEPAAFTDGARLVLDFGKGMPQPVQTTESRPRAALAPPVREAALLRINGKPAGTLWAAPWRIDVTGLLHPGENRIEVMVMNGALNRLAGRPLPDRRLLTLRYGERFQDQDQDKIAPAPSGLLGPVTLERIR